MKKTIALILISFFFIGCSTSNDGNGNTTVVVIPKAPLSLIGQIVSSGQINLSWSDNSTNETGFKVERKIGTGQYAALGTTMANVITFNDTGLNSGVSYTYRVCSYNEAGDSIAYSNEITKTGNNFTITICNQIWDQKNLDVTTYSDGTLIPQVTDQNQWGSLTTGAWCYYNNDSANGSTYGKLYNWYAVAGIYDANSLVNPLLRKKLAPNGWHIPSSNTDLSCLGDKLANKLKEIGSTHWVNNSLSTTNESGFTALPGGSRSGSVGGSDFSDIGFHANFWTTTEDVNNNYLAYSFLILNGISDLYIYNPHKTGGCSVRCIKD